MMDPWRKPAISATIASFLLLAAACQSDDADEPATEGDQAHAEEAEQSARSTGDDSDTTSRDFDPETYFKGQTIRFVTSSAGGGTDAQIRTLASHLPRYIPGNPATQVSNVTPHVAGINYMWNAKPDGLTVGMTSAPTLEFEFFEGAEWDSSEFEYLGAMDSVCDNMMLMRGNIGYDDIEDASGAAEPALVTMTQAPSPAEVEPLALGTMLVAEYLNLPLEVRRVAESGTPALNLAMERGEINFARHGGDWCRMPEANPGWLEDKFIVPVLDVSTDGPGSDMPDVIEERPPHISELVSDEEYEQWRGLVAAPRAGGNPIFLPPGTPAEVRDVLRSALEQAFENEDFVEAMESAYGRMEFSFRDGDEASELFTENLEQMSKYADEYESVTEDLYSKYAN